MIIPIPLKAVEGRHKRVGPALNDDGDDALDDYIELSDWRPGIHSVSG